MHPIDRGSGNEWTREKVISALSFSGRKCLGFGALIQAAMADTWERPCRCPLLMEQMDLDFLNFNN
jgi:hypothetical protein